MSDQHKPIQHLRKLDQLSDQRPLPTPLPSTMAPAVLVEMFGRDPLDPDRGIAA